MGSCLIVFALKVKFSLAWVSVLFLGLSRSVQRAEMWGVILALQSSGAVHLVVLTILVSFVMLDVLLDGHHGSVPFQLVKDGDFLLLIERMLHLRGPEHGSGLLKLRVMLIKGMVLDGWVREVDSLGNDAADEAADFGRRRGW